MVTNIAGLQIKNNVNVIDKFSKRRAFQYFGHAAYVSVIQKWTELCQVFVDILIRNEM